jgi:hypothetical protein
MKTSWIAKIAADYGETLDEMIVGTPHAQRPEWVRCVLTGRYDIPEGKPGGPRLEAKTWCGRDLRKEGEVLGYRRILQGLVEGDAHFVPACHAFIDATHALNVCAKQGRTVPCPECAKAMCEALLRQAVEWDGSPEYREAGSEAGGEDA